jgi:uncharacterized protein (TIGR00255 family)
MTIASMTGFASAVLETPHGSVSVELKTVNHRYLEFQTRIPEDLRALEPALREAVAARLTRGKVDCRIAFAPVASTARAMVPNEDAMNRLHEAAKRVHAHVPTARELSVAEILHWPGVLEDDSMPADELRATVMKTLSKAVAELDATRGREGAKLDAILRERLDKMAVLIEEARPLVPAAMKAFQEKLAARIAEASATPTDERIQQEIVLYAARIDVEEEIGRLATHIAEFRRVLDKGGACGKRLDFLCQELNREANTLGSKSVANDMTRISVELKVLIEQMREQVQNIE